LIESSQILQYLADGMKGQGGWDKLFVVTATNTEDGILEPLVLGGQVQVYWKRLQRCSMLE